MDGDGSLNRSASGKRGVLIRVGVDWTEYEKTKYPDIYPNGGFHGPFRNEGKEFEFIPIPENRMREYHRPKYPDQRYYLKAKKDELSYSDLPGIRLDKRIIDTIREIDRDRESALRDVAVHWDPDFTYMTYGDAEGKGIQELNENDILVFCASLQNQQDKNDYGLFIIGYFTLKKKPFCFGDLNLEERRSIIQEYALEKEKNVHFSKAWARAWNYDTCSELLRDYEITKGKDNWDRFVLALGDKPLKKSGLLSKAKRITDPKPKLIHQKGRDICSHFYITTDVAESLGMTKKQRNWQRGPRPIKGEKHVENLIELMDEGKPFHKVRDPRI